MRIPRIPLVVTLAFILSFPLLALCGIIWLFLPASWTEDVKPTNEELEKCKKDEVPNRIIKKFLLCPVIRDDKKGYHWLWIHYVYQYWNTRDIFDYWQTMYVITKKPEKSIDETNSMYSLD